MRSIEKYYDNTKNAEPNYIVKEFIKLNVRPGNAVELGCGAGRDTVYLIKNGWNVLAIDKENVKSRIVENKNDFEKLWNKIRNSILNDGYFVGNFFGNNDEWKNIKEEMTFLTKRQTIQLFKDFEIIKFKEVEKDGLTGSGKIKHCHIFNVIAKNR